MAITVRMPRLRVSRAAVATLLWVCGAFVLSACAGGEPEPVTAPPPQPPPVRPAPRAAVPQTPDRVRAEIARWFTHAGYKPPQVDALVDYARMESGFRPCAINPAGYRYSFQWSGLRLRRLEEFAGTRTCPPLEKQLAFADRELRGEPNYACFWHASSRRAALTALRRGFGYGRC